MQLTFDEWMKQVEDIAGIDIRDLPDMPYHDWYVRRLLAALLVKKVDLVAYADTWSIREHQSLVDIEESGEPLEFSSESEARQHANDSGWQVVEYDT